MESLQFINNTKLRIKPGGFMEFQCSVYQAEYLLVQKPANEKELCHYSTVVKTQMPSRHDS